MTSIIRGDDNFDSNGIVDGAAKAWVNFNGSGTVAINDSFNVSSITDNGTGDYTINFTNAMNDVNYSVAALGMKTTGNLPIEASQNTSRTKIAESVPIVTSQGATLVNAVSVNVQIFGDQ